MKQVKGIIKTVKGFATQDGAGVNLIRVIGHDDVCEADPFLMLDAFDSKDPSDYVRGFPLHPHRGIETITYLIEGQINHSDSLGNEGSIHSGEAQWMTAGSGILHEEMPQKSDRMYGLQLWLNLPQAEKMTPPQYYDITRDMIETVSIDEGTVRVIAGSFGNIQGIKPRHVQATMLDIDLNPTTRLELPCDYDATVLVYTLEGEGSFGEEAQTINARTAVILGSGDTFAVHSGKAGLRFMLFAAKPLREPVAWGGSFVMNTQEELLEAYRQLDEGTFITA